MSEAKTFRCKREVWSFLSSSYACFRFVTFRQSNKESRTRNREHTPSTSPPPASGSSPTGTVYTIVKPPCLEPLFSIRFFHLALPYLSRRSILLVSCLVSSVIYLSHRQRCSFKVPSGGLTLIVGTEKWGCSCKVQRRPPADIFLNENLPPKTPCGHHVHGRHGHGSAIKNRWRFSKFRKKYETLILTSKIYTLQENGFKELTLVLFESLF